MSRATRALLQASFLAALRRLDLGGAVADAVPRRLVAARGLTVLAVGKAAREMAGGALRATPAEGGRVVLVEPEGVRGPLPRHPAVERLVAAHPDPDRRSVAAARRVRAIVAGSPVTLALLSGGASALLCEPRSLDLARYVRLVRALLLGGATVREVNVVRRHLCRVKGGGLARVAGGPVFTLVASDVIGGGLHDVGSGPTVPDPTSCSTARAVLRRFSPGLSLPRMHESLKPCAARARRLRARFVARPEDLARKLAIELRERGFLVRVLAASVAGADDLAREYLTRARALGPGEAVVRAAEPSLRVAVQSPGRGGRSTHLATLLGPGLPEGVAFLAGASDGVDGTSGTGGAVVDRSLARRVPPDALASALARFDTGSILRDAGMALRCDPTGQNLADVHVLASTRRLRNF